MTDVLKIALENRAELHEEIAKLDEFIRYAESLMRDTDGSEPAVTEAPEPANKGRSEDSDPKNTDIPRPGIIRRGA